MMLMRHRLRQGLKPRFFSVLNRTAEAVPFPRQVLQFRTRFLSSAFLLYALATAGVPCTAQSPSDGGTMDSKPKADIIFEHANIYTGVPANTQFSSILREEAIAVRGDRIQAVGKTVDTVSYTHLTLPTTPYV